MAGIDEIEISRLQRRKIESKALIPFLTALRDKFGEARCRRSWTKPYASWPSKTVPVLAETYGQTTTSLRMVAEEVWAGGGSLDVELVGQSEGHFDFQRHTLRIRRVLQGDGAVGPRVSHALQP